MTIRAALAFCVVVALAACGRVDDQIPDSSSDAGAGGTTASAGRVGSGSSAAQGGSSGRPTSGGEGPGGGAGAIPAGGAGPTGGGGSAGDSGAAGTGAIGASGASDAGGPSTVTVDANGIVFVTYTPASPATVVTVVLDPQCTGFAPGLTLDQTTCANISLMGGVVGTSRVCFALPEEPSLYLERCYAAAKCGANDYFVALLSDGLSRCCKEYFHDTQQPNRVCMSVAEFGSVAYGTGVDSDNDGTPDFQDNCVTIPNISQRDSDHDGIGEVCDNCPTTPNPDQADTDHDGIGDACDAINNPAGGTSGAGGLGGTSGTTGNGGTSGHPGGGSGG